MRAPQRPGRRRTPAAARAVRHERSGALRGGRRAPRAWRALCGAHGGLLPVQGPGAPAGRPFLQSEAGSPIRPYKAL